MILENGWGKKAYHKGLRWNSSKGTLKVEGWREKTQKTWKRGRVKAKTHWTKETIVDGAKWAERYIIGLEYGSWKHSRTKFLLKFRM